MALGQGGRLPSLGGGSGCEGGTGKLPVDKQQSTVETCRQGERGGFGLPCKDTTGLVTEGGENMDGDDGEQPGRDSMAWSVAESETVRTGEGEGAR